MTYAVPRRVRWVLVDPSPRRPTGHAEIAEVDGLLLLVATGDREAFARLYDTLAGRVFGLIKRVLRDHAMSEEVMQEVMLEVWRQAPRYDAARGSGLSWIMTMTHRRAVDRVRSEQSRRDRLAQEMAVSSEPDHDPVIESALQEATGSEVLNAIAGLSEVQRQAIVMAYYEGFTQSEISERLNIPIGTVKTRIRDGMIRLRQSLWEKP
jgi:RNA polymerase sigma-70 factor (ECF subfamily)